MKANKKYGIKPPIRDMGRLYLAIAITAAVALITLMPISDLLKLALGASIAMITYMISTLLTNAINKDDIDNLRGIVKPQPIINLIADKLLNIMEKMATLRLR